MQHDEQTQHEHEQIRGNQAENGESHDSARRDDDQNSGPVPDRKDESGTKNLSDC